MAYRLLTVALLTILGTGVSLAQGAPPFNLFSSKAGRFTVLMPATPTEQKQEIDTDTGKVESVMFIAAGANSSAFIAAYADYPNAARSAEAATMVVSGARDGILRNTKGKLINDKEISLDKNTGRAFLIEQDGGQFFNVRVYLVGKRLYQLIVVGPKAEATGANADRYLTSFKLAVE
jgi:hypothetical protein